MEPIWLEIKTHLEKEKKRIFDEIANYPPPIPACDVQFNFLLEERSNIAQELRRVFAASKGDTGDDNSGKLIYEFIGSCKYIDEDLEAKLVLDLEKVLDRCNH